MVLPALTRGGYTVRTHVAVGNRLGGGRHIVDAVASQSERKLLISLKWQQVRGTAEQKVPFEIMCLADAMERESYDGAYLVLGGEGWRRRHFFVGEGLKKYLKNTEGVEIVTLESFVARSNQGNL